jgi:hypothetical protein
MRVCMHSLAWLGIACMKNIREEHFEFVHRNLFAEDMNEGHMK